MRKSLIVAALAFALAGPALASNCPNEMTAIDEAMETAQLSDAEKTRVETLRAKGEEQHKAGDHAASMQSLKEAKSILGIQ